MAFRHNKFCDRKAGQFNRRALFKCMGATDDDLDNRPLIGIANSWNELVPGHVNLRQIAEQVRKGIHLAGGMVAEFGVIGACDGLSNGHEGMYYSLPSRDLIAGSIEIMVEAHKIDGLVMIGSCDKIVPGMMMAAARLDIPSIITVGGPMLGGVVFDNRKSDMTSLKEAFAMRSRNKITEEQLYQLEDLVTPTCGSCAFYGTANTMCCLSEAIGMSLTGSATIPAVYSERLRSSVEAGKAIVELTKNGVTARKIITLNSLRNAARVLMATGGSTNGVLHLIAVAIEAGIDAKVMMDVLEAVSEDTPHVAKINPASKYNMEDLYKSGGIPQVMKEIAPLLHLDCLTVSGKTLDENLEQHRSPYQPDRDVIKTMKEPFGRSKGLAVLRGNLAPNTGITKPAAIDPSIWTFTGTARTFDCEDDAAEAVLNGKIGEGDVVVIRYEGPKGGPGMREMAKVMKYLYGVGLATKTALVTDGRFSGTNNGCFVGHVSPEAAEGGPIAIVRDGDKITIDIPNNALSLHVSAEEIALRFKDWRKPEPKCKSGFLSIYQFLAQSADKGAVMSVR
ncbi:MAG: dihydroxy-acid dehydratase [Syntrophales bacterium]|nr:dihydroxy-acid dehydratase [Syntrophales bacterium]